MICPHCVFHAVTSFIDVFPILNQQGTALYNGIEHDNLGYHEIAELRKKIYKPRKIDSDEIFINGSRWFQYPELSLAAFLDNMPADMKGKRLLISLRSHMIAAQDNFCADSLCHEPRTRKEFGSGRSRVHHVFVLK